MSRRGGTAQPPRSWLQIRREVIRATPAVKSTGRPASEGRPAVGSLLPCGMVDVVLFALPGVALIVWGIVARRRPSSSSSSSALPPAKIDDGRPFQPSTYERRPSIGGARIALGILLALGGGYFGLIWDAFGHWPGMKR